MKRHIFTIGLVLILCSVGVLCFANARTKGYTYHYVQVVNDRGEPIAGITSVDIYKPGTVVDANAWSDSALADALTIPLTTSSTNTTLSDGAFSWWGPDGWDAKITDGETTTYFKDGTASTNRIIMVRPKTVHKKHTLELFEVAPIVATKADGGGAATGTAGDENTMLLPGGWFEYHIIGTQTILQPMIAATGLDIGFDQADAEGVEITQGITSLSPAAFTVGTDPAFFVRASFSIADASGANDLCVGFRKAEAYQADNQAYDELAGIGPVSTGILKTQTILNGADTTFTDTTWDVGDASTHSFQVNVSAAGVVTYLLDGVQPPTVAAFTFDDAEVVIPFIYFLNDADVAGAVVFLEYECGHQ